METREVLMEPKLSKSFNSSRGKHGNAPTDHMQKKQLFKNMILENSQYFVRGNSKGATFRLKQISNERDNQPGSIRRS